MSDGVNSALGADISDQFAIGSIMPIPATAKYAPVTATAFAAAPAASARLSSRERIAPESAPSRAQTVGNKPRELMWSDSTWVSIHESKALRNSSIAPRSRSR